MANEHNSKIIGEQSARNRANAVGDRPLTLEEELKHAYPRPGTPSPARYEGQPGFSVQHVGGEAAGAENTQGVSGQVKDQSSETPKGSE